MDASFDHCLRCKGGSVAQLKVAKWIAKKVAKRAAKKVARKVSKKVARKATKETR